MPTPAPQVDTSRGYMTCASSSNQFFTGTSKNDVVIYHNGPTKQIVLGVQDPTNHTNHTNAMFITSSNVKINIPLEVAQLSSPVSGLLTLAPQATSGILTVIDQAAQQQQEDIQAHQMVIVSRGTTPTAAIISGTTVTYTTQTSTQPVTINIDDLGHVTITNNLTSDLILRWTLLRLI